VDQKPARTNYDQRSEGNNSGSAVQRPVRGQPLDQLTTNKGARHCRDVEPQPLLIDEGIAGAQFLAVLDEDGAADRARYCHAVGGQQQRDDDLARRGDPRDPAIGACGHQVREN